MSVNRTFCVYKKNSTGHIQVCSESTLNRKKAFYFPIFDSTGDMECFVLDLFELSHFHYNRVSLTLLKHLNEYQ